MIESMEMWAMMDGRTIWSWMRMIQEGSWKCRLVPPSSGEASLNANIFGVCARLHNFVIDNKEDKFSVDDLSLDGPNIRSMVVSLLGWGYFHTVEDLQTYPGTL
jgi:hypothetical protein